MPEKAVALLAKC